MPHAKEDFVIPSGKYTRKSFEQTLIEKYDEVFLPSKKRKWIKIHGVRTRPGEWKELVKPYLRRQLGEITHVSLPLSGTFREGRPVDFYICEYAPELLLFYTASKDWDYEHSLKRFIRETIGLGQMWLGPEQFENIFLYMMDKYRARIKRFFARRDFGETLPTKVGRDVPRRIYWGAEDSFETIFELKEQYGVRPTSVLMQLKDGMMQLNNDGMFVLTRMNYGLFQVFDEAMSYLIKEETRLTTTSQSVRLEIEKVETGLGELVVPQLSTGTVLLSEARLGASDVDKIMESSKFDFLDSSAEEGSFSWIATAIDREKKSVFGISSDEKSIHLVPRYGTTFESFLDFYRQIVEEVDPKAVFQSTGGVVGR